MTRLQNWWAYKPTTLGQIVHSFTCVPTMNNSFAYHYPNSRAEQTEEVSSDEDFSSRQLCSFENALAFLEDYTIQAQVYLAEMKQIEKDLKSGLKQGKIPGVLVLDTYQRDCNRIFEKLKRRLGRFMERSRGVKL